MPTPSLLIVPARFKTGKLYSQIPTSGAGDFTVTRNTTATRFNSAGLIESVASGIPRLDYFASGGVTGCPALLVEPAATNLKPRSDDWTNSAFTLTRVTQTQSANVAPLTKPMLEVRETAVTGTHNIQIQPDATLVSGSIYTRSFFVSLAGRDVINFGDSGQLNSECRINFSTKTVISQGANVISSRIVDYGNGLFLVSITFTATGTIGRTSIALFLDNTTQSYLGDITKGVNIHFIQYELGSVPTSYIPTTAGTGSRSADIISVTGAVSGSIGQTEGTIYAEVDIRTFSNLGHIATISDGTNANRLEVYKFTDGKIYFDRISATQSALSNAGSSAYTAPTILKIAVGYKSGDSRMYINGVAATAQQLQTFTFGALTKVNIGSNRFDDSRFNDRIRAVALYTTRLTNAELATLTTL